MLTTVSKILLSAVIEYADEERSFGHIAYIANNRVKSDIRNDVLPILEQQYQQILAKMIVCSSGSDQTQLRRALKAIRYKLKLANGLLSSNLRSCKVAANGQLLDVQYDKRKQLHCK